MSFLLRSMTDPASRRRWLRIVCIVAALGLAVPIGFNAYERLVSVNVQARARLIQHHRLWENEPGFRGRPEVWTRMASWLLSDQQLIRRLNAKYGGQAQEIELEYRRDVTMARAEVIVSALALWGFPLAAIYGVVWVVRRRRAKPAPPVKTQPASVHDPRYRPPA